MNMMYRKFPKTALVILVLLFFNVHLFAQIGSDPIIVVAPYDPTISDAFKINENPKIVDTVKYSHKLTYSLSPKLIKTSFELEPIKVAKMGPESISKLYSGFIKLGFGTLTMPYGEVYYNNSRSSKCSYGLHYKHVSSLGQIDKYANSKFSDNEVNLYGRKFIKKNTLSGGIDYKRNVVHFYGYQPENYVFSMLDDDIKQRFSLVSADVKYSNSLVDTVSMNSSYNLKYYNLGDLYDASENNFLLKASFFRYFKFMKSIPKQVVGLDLDFDYFKNVNSYTSFNSSVFRLFPFVGVNMNDYRFTVGLNNIIQSDSVSKIRFVPVIDISVNLVNNILIAYAGYDGNVQHNSLRKLSDENPFINSMLPLRDSYNKSKIYGGFKGSMSSTLSFNLSASSAKVEDMPLFINDYSNVLLNKFTVVYDTLDIINAKAEVAYNTEKLGFVLTGNYFQYTPVHELKAWHKPNYEVKLTANYKIQNKIIVKADLLAYGTAYAKLIDVKGIAVAEKINGYIDGNLSIDYRYTKKLSVFLELNNIASSKYDKWYNYPARRFSLMAGVTYSFL